MPRRYVDVTEFTVSDKFRVSAPAGPTGWYNSHDSEVLLLLKNDSVDGSGIFVDYCSVNWLANEAETRLADASERFLNDSVIPNSRYNLTNAMSTSWSDGRVTTFRTWANMSPSETWVFQLAFHAASKTVFILHWHGEPSLIESDILPVFDTFTVLAEG